VLTNFQYMITDGYTLHRQPENRMHLAANSQRRHERRAVKHLK